MKSNLSTNGIDRRTFLKGFAGAATLAIAGAPSIVHGQSKGTAIVGTWGGSYGHLLHESIEEPILTPAGWKVVQDLAGAATRSAKLIAGQKMPKGQTDVQAFDGVDMFRLYRYGITREIDYSRIPNAEHLLSSAKLKYGVGQIYSALVPIYLQNMVKKPTSFKDVYNPEHGDKLAFLSEHYQQETLAATLAAGGSSSDLESGKKLLLECIKAGARVYPQQDLYVQGLKNQEFYIGTNWKARAYNWKNDGIPIEATYPSEGGVFTMFGFVIPKNAPNVDGAYAYLNAMLDPSAATNFAKVMGYNPTIDNAEIPPNLDEQIGFTKQQRNDLKHLDYQYLLDHNVELKNWWGRHVGRPG